MNSPRSRRAPQQRGPADGVAEFEALYRANVAAVTAYFARRSADPQTVADLTADTFVAAITSLIDRIDAERAGRALVTELTALPAADRAVVELVDLAGLQPKEAAQVLGVAPGTLRMRLMRGRARLRKAASPHLAHGTDPASEPEVKT